MLEIRLDQDRFRALFVVEVVIDVASVVVVNFVVVVRVVQMVVLIVLIHVFEGFVDWPIFLGVCVFLVADAGEQVDFDQTVHFRALRGLVLTVDLAVHLIFDRRNVAPVAFERLFVTCAAGFNKFGFIFFIFGIRFFLVNFEYFLDLFLVILIVLVVLMVVGQDASGERSLLFTGVGQVFVRILEFVSV